MKSKFRSALMLSADTPEELRACDVGRVMAAAEEFGVRDEFRTWLLTHDLISRTREVILAV